MLSQFLNKTINEINISITLLVQNLILIPLYLLGTISKLFSKTVILKKPIICKIVDSVHSSVNNILETVPLVVLYFPFHQQAKSKNLFKVV